MAAGIRRIEAITGAAAEQSVHTMEDILFSIREMFNAKDVKAALQKVLDENSALKKQADDYRKEKLTKVRNELVSGAKEINGVKVVKHVFVADIDASLVKDLAFQIAGMLPEKMLCVFGSKSNDKPLITVMISKDLVADKGLDAGKLVREAGKLIKGGGGGAPHFATAGGKDTTGIDAAVEKVLELCEL